MIYVLAQETGYDTYKIIACYEDLEVAQEDFEFLDKHNAYDRFKLFEFEQHTSNRYVKKGEVKNEK